MSDGPENYHLRLEQFLKHILPDTGAYICTWKKPAEHGMKQAVARTVSELATLALHQSNAGFDTYFACASYTGQPLTLVEDGEQRVKYRTVEQIVGVRSLWIDLDAGDGKPYPDAATAVEALRAWLSQHGFPNPTLVSSGHGLHCYWRLDRMLPYPEWLALAVRFKAFTMGGMLHAGPERTADGASILRPPFTFNYKRGGRAPVVPGPLQPEVNVDQLLAWLPHAPVPVAPVSRVAPDAFTTIHADAPAYALTAAQHCAWLRFVGAGLRGNVEEPLWYAMLGLLAYATDGPSVAHAWSIGYPAYDMREVNDKMQQAAQRQTGPTTCAAFAERWSAGCKGCRFKGTITTPLQLGRGAVGASPPAAVTQALTPAPDMTMPPLLHQPYFWHFTGALGYLAKEGEAGEKVVLRQLYDNPIYVESLRSGEVSRIAYAHIRHFSPHDGWRAVNLPSGDLSGDGSYKILANNHIEVPPNAGKQFTTFLIRSKMEYKKHRQTDLQHETFGWKDNGFLIGETLVLRGARGVVGISDELKRYSEKLHCVGDARVWSAAVQPLFRPGYEHQAFAVLASMAAPLMRFAPYPGTVYSIVHPESGKGKTLGIEVGTSVWGGEKALWVSHRDEKVTTGDTLKSQFRAFALFKSLPIFIDEMRDADPEKLRSMILSFTDGNPPTALTRDGVMRAKFGTWKTVIISTSNKSITDIVTVNNDPAAANRVFEVTATLPPDADAKTGNAIRKGAMDNYGWAGIMFLERLLEPEMLAYAEDRVREDVDRLTVELQSAKGAAGGGDRYIASFLACTLLAAELAGRFGILQCDVAQLKAWAFERWAAQRTQIDMSHRNDLENLGAFIRDNISNTLTVERDARGNDVSVVIGVGGVRAPLTIRYERSTGIMQIDRATLQRWCLPQNVHFHGFIHALKDMGVITDDNARKNLGAGTDYKGSGQTRVVIVDTVHPLMSGVLREVSDTAKPAGAESKTDEKVSNVRVLKG